MQQHIADNAQATIITTTGTPSSTGSCSSGCPCGDGAGDPGAGAGGPGGHPGPGAAVHSPFSFTRVSKLPAAIRFIAFSTCFCVSSVTGPPLAAQASWQG